MATPWSPCLFVPLLADVREYIYDEEKIKQDGNAFKLSGCESNMRVTLHMERFVHIKDRGGPNICRHVFV
jgi:hypothetical protein